MLLRDAVEKLLDQEKITFARFLYDKIECAQIKREIKTSHKEIQQEQSVQQKQQRKYNNDASPRTSVGAKSPRTSGTSSDGWWRWFTRTKKRT